MYNTTNRYLIKTIKMNLNIYDCFKKKQNDKYMYIYVLIK